MNKTELKYEVEKTNPHFFTSKTMKFFGDTMKNYGVRSAVIDTYSATGVNCWELYRIHAVKHGLQDSAYFTKDTFHRVHIKR
jgi:hypothetical protein